jgi:hypothetical protein
MNKLRLFFISMLCSVFLFFSDNYAQLFVENFDYPAGDSLINHSWVNHSGTGTQITVTSGSLTYSGYQGSGIGNSTTINGGSGSREDIHANFTKTGSGSLYAAFLVNVISASTTGDYFLHLAPAFPTTFFKPRLFVKNDGTGNLQFGISKTSGSIISYTTSTYSFNTTYLLVLKYAMPAGDSNDVGSLYINPGFISEPGTADIVSTDFTTPDDSIASIALRQGSQLYSVQVDGIIIGTSWNSIFPPSTFSSTFTVYNSWNIVSFPGIQPNSMHKDTLYRFRDLSASVYTFDGSYNSIDTLRNGDGYWLKHTGQRTYRWNGTVQSGVLYPELSYADIQNFNGTSGWNLFGVYDYQFLTSDLTTNPPGLINQVYGYVPGSGYQLAVTLEPGKGYWINLSGDGEIIYPARPTSVPKAVKEEREFENLAKIIISDAAGNQYTLYVSNDSNQLNSYSLPPKPPAGLFDVRFTTDRFIENISTMKTIDISGAEYPVTILVQGLNLKLSDAVSGKILNEKIQDGERYIINSNALNRLLVSSDDLTPMSYELSQNYPNPFNPTTNIRYTIPESGLVSLRVYNSIGEEVAVLVNSIQESGNYEVEFNSTGLASGIYLYKMISGNFVETRKMILLK